MLFFFIAKIASFFPTENKTKSKEPICKKKNKKNKQQQQQKQKFIHSYAACFILFIVLIITIIIITIRLIVNTGNCYLKMQVAISKSINEHVYINTSKFYSNILTVCFYTFYVLSDTILRRYCRNS